MRKIYKLAIFAMSAFLMFMPIKSNANSNVLVEDNADLLSDKEEENLDNLLRSFDPDINYYVVTNESNLYGKDVDKMLEGFYTSEFPENEDGIAMIIDMYTRTIYLQGYGQIQYELTNSDAYDITDNVYTYATNQQYYNCFYNALIQVNNHLNEIAVPRPMRWIVTAILSVIIGFLGTFFFAMIERSEIKPQPYIKDVEMKGSMITSKCEITKTTKTPRYSDNSGSSSFGSSSGGGYSGGFSGGGFSGGGGGFSGGGSSGGGHSGGGHSF